MKKTILYLITQSELGGAQRYIFDLAENLRNEFNVSVAVGEQGEKGELAKQLKRANIKYHIIPRLKRAISPINDFVALIEIIKLIKKIKPDIIHLNSSKISILGSIASKICYMLHITCYVIYTVHGWVFNEPLPKWKKLFYKYAEKFTAILKDKIICVSEFDRQIAIKKKICNPKKLTTIHNGIRPISFLPRKQAHQKLFSTIPPLINKERGLGGEVIIGTIANLYPTKGLKYLIEAIYILKEKFSLLTSDFLLLIIGEGEERKNLENLISRLNLKSHVFLAGKIDNAAELLSAFDIFVCSSVKEGFPYMILEAMSAGIPIVSTNVGGIPEMITDKQTGFLIKPENPQILSKKIQELVNNPGLRQKLGKQAKIKAEQEFGLERMVEETKRIYLKT